VSETTGRSQGWDTATVQAGTGTVARPVGVRTVLGVLALLAGLLGAHVSPTATAAHHLPGGGTQTAAAVAVREPAGSVSAPDRPVMADLGLPADLPDLLDCLLFLGGLAGALLILAVSAALTVALGHCLAPRAGGCPARVPEPRLRPRPWHGSACCGCEPARSTHLNPLSGRARHPSLRTGCCLLSRQRGSRLRAPLLSPASPARRRWDSAALSPRRSVPALPEPPHIRPLQPVDLPFAAALHAAALPHGFFARLGSPFLRVYYAGYLRSPYAVALVAERRGDVREPLGVLVGTLDTAAHNGGCCAITGCGWP
jgi:hypothetical protein